MAAFGEKDQRPKAGAVKGKTSTQGHKKSKSGLLPGNMDSRPKAGTTGSKSTTEY